MKLPGMVRMLLCVGAVALAAGGVAEAKAGFLWRRSKAKIVLPRPKAPDIVLPEAVDIFPLVEPDSIAAPERADSQSGTHKLAISSKSLREREPQACYDEDFFDPVEVIEMASADASRNKAEAAPAVAEPAPDVRPAAAEKVTNPATNAVGIFGEAQVGPEAMARFVASRNKDFDPRIARAFHEVGRRYGIRGDIALCQAIIETGWFMFNSGTAVTPSQHNYCGLGVLKKGMRGHSFESIEEGVTAQIQHLYAYASKEALPKGEPVIDPRFSLVARGCATTWHDLSNRWAMNPAYGASIMDLYQKLLQFK